MKSEGLDAPESSPSKPSRTTTTLVELLGPTLLVDPGTAKPTTDVIHKQTSIVLLYFSAHWCPPCKAFTPVLRNFYKASRSGKPPPQLEIVYVSSDQTLAEFNEYFGKSMPWTALGHGASDDASIKAKTRLAQLFRIRSIPTLVVLRRDDDDNAPGKEENWLFVTSQGREHVSARSPSSPPEQLVQKWMEMPAVPLDEAASGGGGGAGGGFSLTEIITTLLRNPMYLFALIYLVKFVYRSFLSPSAGGASDPAPALGEDPHGFGSGNGGDSFNDAADSEF